MAGTSTYSLCALFFSWVWQNPDKATWLVLLLRKLASNSEKLEEFLDEISAVAAHEMTVEEAEGETNEALDNKAAA